MNTRERAHKIRLNPTDEQEQYFRQATENALEELEVMAGIINEQRDIIQELKQRVEQLEKTAAAPASRKQTSARNEE